MGPYHYQKRALTEKAQQSRLTSQQQRQRCSTPRQATKESKCFGRRRSNDHLQTPFKKRNGNDNRSEKTKTAAEIY